MTVQLHLADCREVMRAMAPCSVDAIVSDPPCSGPVCRRSSGGPRTSLAGRRTSVARSTNAGLRGTGWALTEVAINTITGFVWIQAQRHDGNVGRMVTIIRSAHGARTLEHREVIELKPGMYRSFWTLVPEGELGRRHHAGPKSALRALSTYIDDNRADGCDAIPGREALRALAGSIER